MEKETINTKHEKKILVKKETILSKKKERKK
jgi:hypothetical protein